MFSFSFFLVYLLFIRTKIFFFGSWVTVPSLQDHKISPNDSYGLRIMCF